MYRKVSMAVVVLVCLAAVAQAIPTITVPDVVLQLNQAGQIVNINVAGGDLVPGLNFVMQVADPTGPIITGVDITGPGTVFNPSNTGQGSFGPALPSRITGWTTTTIATLPPATPGFVAATGLLGIITFDTTGVAPGQYLYRMTAVDGLGDTDFTINLDGDPIVANFAYTTTDPNLPTGNQGSSRLIIEQITPPLPGPEPGTMVLGAFALAGFGIVALRKRRG